MKIAKSCNGTTLAISCNACSNREYLHTLKETKAFRIANLIGWKYTRKYGWVCPTCQRSWNVGGPVA